MVSADPWSSRIIAGVAARGLYKSDDNGASWQQLGTGAGSAPITHRPSNIIYDVDDPNKFWEAGIYSGGGAFATTNRGNTFTQLGTISHNDMISVDMHDPQRRTLLTGGHEQVQAVQRSTNGGTSWTNIGSLMPANSSFSSHVLALDSDSYLVGTWCGWVAGVCGVWRTHDSGATWTQSASQLSPGAPPLWHSSGAIYWPRGWNGPLWLSTDLGVTWEEVAGSLSSPVELPDGRILGLQNGNTLVVSANGRTWTQVGQQIPFQANGITYSAWTKTVYAWQWDCGPVVLPAAIWKAGFNYQQ
jgi:hypothetical protein